MGQKKIDRRNFLKNSALVAGAMGLNIFPFANAFGAPASSKKVVFVFLRGAADILSLFPPMVDSKGMQDYNFHPLKNYRGVDANMARLFLFNTKVNSVATANALKISDHQVLFHPQFEQIQNIIASNQFALLFHTGSLNETRSHFDQMDYMESGSDLRKLANGFLARSSSLASSRFPIALGANIPRSMLGGDPVLLDRASDLKFLQRTTGVQGKDLSRSERLELFKAHQDPEVCADKFLCKDAQNAQERYENLQGDLAAYTDMAGNKFVSTCDLAAKLTNVQSNPSIITIDYGGWDHHFNENPTQPNSVLSQNVNFLAQGLKALHEKMSSDTVVAVVSEFGRTLVANKSNGTDHGRASAMIVMGSSIKRSTLTNVDKKWDLTADGITGANSSRALKVKTDFRQIMAEILHKHMGQAPSSVTPLSAQISGTQTVNTIFDGLTTYTNRRIFG